MERRLSGEPSLGFEAISAFTWAAKRLHRHLERYAEAYGLSEGRLQVLFRVRFQDCGGVPLGELAEMLRVSPRNITGLVDMLERDGLVTRAPDPTDRRSILAQLTDHGRERIDAIWRGAMGAQGRLMEGFTDDELRLLRHTCLRLVERLDPAVAKSHEEDPA